MIRDLHSALLAEPDQIGCFLGERLRLRKKSALEAAMRELKSKLDELETTTFVVAPASMSEFKQTLSVFTKNELNTICEELCARRLMKRQTSFHKLTEEMCKLFDVL